MVSNTNGVYKILSVLYFTNTWMKNILLPKSMLGICLWMQMNCLHLHGMGAHNSEWFTALGSKNFIFVDNGDNIDILISVVDT